MPVKEVAAALSNKSPNENPDTVKPNMLVWFAPQFRFRAQALACFTAKVKPTP